MPSSEHDASITQLREIAVAALCALLATWLLAKLLTQYARGLWRIVVFIWRVLNLLWFATWLWSLVQRSPQAQLMAQRMLVGGGPLALSIWQQCFPASHSSPTQPRESSFSPDSAGPAASYSSRAATSAPASSATQVPTLQEEEQQDALSRLSQVLRRFV